VRRRCFHAILLAHFLNGREHWDRLAVLGRLKDEPHGLADANSIEIGIDEIVPVPATPRHSVCALKQKGQSTRG
jgi:hypothetical protein